jgi:hypothetical protein
LVASRQRTSIAIDVLKGVISIVGEPYVIILGNLPEGQREQALDSNGDEVVQTH